MTQIAFFDLIGTKNLLEQGNQIGINNMLLLHQEAYNLIARCESILPAKNKKYLLKLQPIIHCFSDSLLLTSEEEVVNEEFIKFTKTFQELLFSKGLNNFCIAAFSDDIEDSVIPWAGIAYGRNSVANFNAIPKSKTIAFRNIFHAEKIISKLIKQDRELAEIKYFICAPVDQINIGRVQINISADYELRYLG